MENGMKVVAISGGVGGAKLARGLALLGDDVELSIVVNTGDDFEHLGLLISPDIDTVTYALAGIANREMGWGRENESYNVFSELATFEAPTWFRLGDRDLALHLDRTGRLRRGERLTEVTAHICARLGIKAAVLPMTDAPVPTRVQTEDGELDFQDYFVRQRCEPVVKGFHFFGIEDATISREVRHALTEADVIVFGPSNPFVSIDPILSLRGMRDLISAKPAVAISPIVAGGALKGPAAKMLHELGLDVSALAVARKYAGLMRGFIIDRQDEALAPAIESTGLRVYETDTVMTSDEDRRRLARETLDFALSLSPVAPWVPDRAS
jgi:LPPG:FO 2-phospho-L-lactate transferase